MGHWVLQLRGGADGAWKDPGAAVAYRVAGLTSDDERDANQFAAAALMPAPLVTEYRERFASPAKLAAMFGVSLEAMQIRLETIRRLTGAVW